MNDGVESTTSTTVPTNNVENEINKDVDVFTEEIATSTKVKNLNPGDGTEVASSGIPNDVEILQPSNNGTDLVKLTDTDISKKDNIKRKKRSIYSNSMINENTNTDYITTSLSLFDDILFKSKNETLVKSEKLRLTKQIQSFSKSLCDLETFSSQSFSKNKKHNLFEIYNVFFFCILQLVDL